MKRNLLVILACALIALCVISCDDHAHTYSDDWSYDETYHWHAATCEHTDAVKDKAEHVWNDGEITTPATADKKGVKTYTCTICKKATKTEEISICTEHKFGDWKDGGNGKHYHECSVCGLKEEQAHTYGDWKDGGNGKHYHECSVCGFKEEKDHTYGDWTKTGENHSHVCTVCSHEEVDAHTFESWTVDGTNEKSTCSVCKYEATGAISKWDGTTDTSWYDSENPKTEYTLTTASQLAGLASLVNGGTGDDETKLGNGVSFEGVTIKLAVGVDLGDKEWTPIGLYGDKNDSSGFNKKVFSGTFDGQGHTISGLKITNDNGKSSYRALFGYADGTVRNFTVKGEIKAQDSSGVVAALGAGGTVENVTNEVNVTVSKTSTDQHAKVAGIVVALKGKGTHKIINCTNNGAISNTSTEANKPANDAIGGILAFLWGDINDTTIENCTNNGKIATGSWAQAAGGIVGYISGSSKNTQITNCTNKGEIKNTAGWGKQGGAIVGEIEKEATVTMTGCTPSDDTAVGGGTLSTSTSD